MSNILKNDDLLRYIRPDHTQYYATQIFENAIDIDPSWMVEVRKIGKYRMQDGTQHPAEQVSTAQLLQFEQENPIPGLVSWIVDRVNDAAPVGIGSFMAPAFLNDRRATDASVRRLVSVCADFDTGNPQANLDALCKRLGVRPTILARSGGITQEGYYKLHAHWRLDEPCDEPWKIAYVREQIAKMFGGDQSFKRIPQIIRIPGSLYDKDGRWATVEIIESNNADVGVNQWEEQMGIDFHNLDQDSFFSQKNQTKTKEERAARVNSLHKEEIHAGGVEETRFGRFSEYAGHQIRNARLGHQSEEEAFQSVQIWVSEKMVPAWDNQRVHAEFHALLQRDKVNHSDTWAERHKPPIQLGMPTPANIAPFPPAQPESGIIVPNAVSQPVEKTQDFDIFDVDILYHGEAPPERHLIENFLVHGSTSAIVAAGGVGKTFVTLELAMRAAAGNIKFGNNPNLFMGFPVLEKMNTIMFTVEDGQHDIHRRVCAIDPDGSLRRAARGFCHIVPIKEQLMNGLTLVEKDKTGNYSTSAAWKYLVEVCKSHIEKSPDRMKYPLLVIIDTYSATHHGDENNAVAVNEWFRAAGLLKQLDASLVITHHTRKSDPKAEIKTVEDMLAAVRGSTAFINALRFVVGIWPMPNGDAVLKEIPREPGQRLYNMGILKNNTGISWAERSNPKFQDPLLTLSRSGFGRLFFDWHAHKKRLELGEGKKEKLEASRAHLRASIRHVVRWYAEAGWPISGNMVIKEKDSLLPHPVNSMSQKDITTALEELLNKEGSIRQVSGVVPRGEVLDVPEGAFFSGIQKQRIPVRPNIIWAHFKYDAENESFNLIPNSQHAMDF